MHTEMTRRDLLRGATALGVGVAAGMTGGEVEAAVETMKGVPFAKTPTVRIGFIGLGGRGSGLFGDLLAIDGVRIVAVCDLVTERARNAGGRAEKAGQPAPE